MADRALPAAFVEGAVHSFGSYRMTREEMLAFAHRWDPQPFHVDPIAVEAHPFFTDISASGWHTAAVVQRLTVDRWEASGVESLAVLGVEDLEWSRPVYPGDTLHIETRVLETRPSDSKPGVYVVRALSRVVNQDGEEVMRLTSTAMFRAPEA